MNSKIKNAVKGGGVASIGIILVVAIAAFVFGPAVGAWGFCAGWWSFQNAVIVLLLLAIYFGGSGSD